MPIFAAARVGLCTSGGPIVADNNTAISVHRGWTDFDNKGTANEGVPINHHRNDAGESIEAFAVMAGEIRDGMLECDTFGSGYGDSLEVNFMVWD
ncbi:hypothetical protein DL767_008619 [Monosporascus sp. MG133]|nr:hypothetical protein DL767_008619 [Monosporascus sp. MG133]